MDTKTLKHLLDACFTAKHIIETLPELPKGMKPRHIHVLDRIHLTWEEKGECRVSDVSEGLHTTMPSITKLIQELAAMKLVEKYPDQADKRVALLRLTAQGRLCVNKYVYSFHDRWTKNLADLSNEDAEKAIRVLERLAHSMPDQI